MYKSKDINLFESDDYIELKNEPILKTKEILIYGIDLDKNILKVINIYDGTKYFTHRNLNDKVCNLKVDSLLKIWNENPEMKENIRYDKATDFYENMKEINRIDELLKKFDELKVVLKNSIKNKLLIYDYSVTGSDYTIGFDVSIENTNTTKTIKYIYFEVIIKNPVNDIVAIKTVRGVGPIEPEMRSS